MGSDEVVVSFDLLDGNVRVVRSAFGTRRNRDDPRPLVRIDLILAQLAAGTFFLRGFQNLEDTDVIVDSLL